MHSGTGFWWIRSLPLLHPGLSAHLSSWSSPLHLLPDIWSPILISIKARLLIYISLFLWLFLFLFFSFLLLRSAVIYLFIFSSTVLALCSGFLCIWRLLMCPPQHKQHEFPGFFDHAVSLLLTFFSWAYLSTTIVYRTLTVAWSICWIEQDLFKPISCGTHNYTSWSMKYIIDLCSAFDFP